MDATEKPIRRLLFAMMELESALRTAGRPLASESIALATKQSQSLERFEFLNHCRETLEAVLLGERDLGEDLLGQILDALASVDEALV